MSKYRKNNFLKNRTALAAFYIIAIGTVTDDLAASNSSTSPLQNLKEEINQRPDFDLGTNLSGSNCADPSEEDGSAANDLVLSSCGVV